MPQARLGGSRSRGFARRNNRGEQRLMTRTRLGLAVSAIIAAGTVIPTSIQAACPAGSSAREIQNEVQKAEPRVEQVIDRANDHFRKGKLNLEDNKRQQEIGRASRR